MPPLPRLQLRNGHAIEARIYAEDSDNNFIPSPGRITHLNEPSGPGIRLDSGIYEGFEIPVFYDPLIAKLICWAPDRISCISRMSRALSEYRIIGVKTILPLLTGIMRDAHFMKGELSTHFLEHFKTDKTEIDHEKLAAIAAVSEKIAKRKSPEQHTSTKRINLWKMVGRRDALQ